MIARPHTLQEQVVATEAGAITLQEVHGDRQQAPHHMRQPVTELQHNKEECSAFAFAVTGSVL